MAQPAITKQLHDLEKELESGQLFERVGRHLRLTQSGQVLLNHARTILSQVKVLRSEMRDYGELRHGRVTIGAPPTVGERLLPELLETFHQQYPNLELFMNEANSRTLMELMDAGEIDLAIINMPVRERNLRITPLFKEPLVLVVSLNHRLVGKPVVKFSELADEPFLLFSPGSVLETTLAACKTAGFSPKVVLNGGSVEMLLRLAEAGLGVAVMPQLAPLGHSRVAVLPLEPIQWRTLALASREDRALTPATLALRNFLEKQLYQPETVATPPKKGRKKNV